MKRLIGIGGIVLLGLSFGSAGWAADGEALYKQYMCGACHGAGKKGGDLKASKLDKAAMIKYAKDPKSVNPKATMTPTKASEADLGAIIDFLKK